MRRLNLAYILSAILFLLWLTGAGYGGNLSETPAPSENLSPLSSQDVENLKSLFRQFIAAENRHDVGAVKPFLWNSPSTLFVAKTATPDEGNWAGFWGREVVLQHFADLYRGTFKMEPDYTKQKIVGLTADVAEVYTPFQIAVSYAGQTPVPKPFLIVMNWIRTTDGWRMASDIAIPVPGR
jgi:hypothetical protein